MGGAAQLVSRFPRLSSETCGGETTSGRGDELGETADKSAPAAPRANKQQQLRVLLASCVSAPVIIDADGQVPVPRAWCGRTAQPRPISVDSDGPGAAEGKLQFGVSKQQSTVLTLQHHVMRLGIVHLEFFAPLSRPSACSIAELRQYNKDSVKYEQQPCWKSPERVDTWNVRPVATIFLNWPPTLQQLQ
ncbi:hypothetical protein TrVFT333_008365 [Trichoderma virens FT-333]|nr:hypothetical protein TrVFT333_008365 [Trichoderma virens FT-333]